MNLDSLGFKFEIGQIVYHRLGFKSKYDKEGTTKTPLLILERLAQECIGGVQPKYLCRLGTSSGVSSITLEPRENFTFMEFELEKKEEE